MPPTSTHERGEVEEQDAAGQAGKDVVAEKAGAAAVKIAKTGTDARSAIAPAQRFAVSASAALSGNVIRVPLSIASCYPLAASLPDRRSAASRKR